MPSSITRDGFSGLPLDLEDLAAVAGRHGWTFDWTSDGSSVRWDQDGADPQDHGPIVFRFFYAHPVYEGHVGPAVHYRAPLSELPLSAEVTVEGIDQAFQRDEAFLGEKRPRHLRLRMPPPGIAAEAARNALKMFATKDSATKGEDSAPKKTIPLVHLPAVEALISAAERETETSALLLEPIVRSMQVAMLRWLIEAVARADDPEHQIVMVEQSSIWWRLVQGGAASADLLQRTQALIRLSGELRQVISEARLFENAVDRSLPAYEAVLERSVRFEATRGACNRLIQDVAATLDLTRPARADRYYGPSLAPVRGLTHGFEADEFTRRAKDGRAKIAHAQVILGVAYEDYERQYPFENSNGTLKRIINNWAVIFERASITGEDVPEVPEEIGTLARQIKSFQSARRSSTVNRGKTVP